MAEHVAGRFQRQAAGRQYGFVIDEAGVAAARRQHDDILARPVHVAMRGVGVLGVKAGAAARELLTIAAAPVEIGVGRRVESLDQLRRLAQKAFGGEDLVDGAPGDLRRHDANGVGGQHALGVGFQLDHHLAGFVVRRRHIVEARDDIGQRLGGDARREQPAVNGVGGQIAHHRRQHLLELIGLEALAAGLQRVTQRRQLRGSRPHVRTRRAIGVLEEGQFVVGEMDEVDLDLVAEAQLLGEFGAGRKTLHQRFDILAFDLNIHRRSRLSSG